MIEIITCECGSADGLARKLLRKVTPDYMSYPVHKGKRAAVALLDSLPEEIRNTETIHKLYELVQIKSKFVVVIGYDEGSVAWANVVNGSAKEFLDGEIILEKYMV